MCGVCAEIGETCLKIFELSLDVCQVARGWGWRDACSRAKKERPCRAVCRSVNITVAGVNHKP